MFISFGYDNFVQDKIFKLYMIELRAIICKYILKKIKKKRLINFNESVTNN